MALLIAMCSDAEFNLQICGEKQINKLHLLPGIYSVWIKATKKPEYSIESIAKLRLGSDEVFFLQSHYS